MRRRAMLFAVTTAAASAIGLGGSTLHAHAAGSSLCNNVVVFPSSLQPFTVSVDLTPLSSPAPGERIGVCVTDLAIGFDEEVFVIEEETTTPGVFVGQTTGLVGVPIAVQVGYNVMSPAFNGKLASVTVCVGLNGAVTCQSIATPI